MKSRNQDAFFETLYLLCSELVYMHKQDINASIVLFVACIFDPNIQHPTLNFGAYQQFTGLITPHPHPPTHTPPHPHPHIPPKHRNIAYKEPFAYEKLFGVSDFLFL